MSRVAEPLVYPVVARRPRGAVTGRSGSWVTSPRGSRTDDSSPAKSGGVSSVVVPTDRGAQRI